MAFIAGDFLRNHSPFRKLSPAGGVRLCAACLWLNIDDFMLIICGTILYKNIIAVEALVVT